MATRGGVRLLQHGTVLSEVRARPGPAHSVVDVMAAVLQALEVGPRVAMLGFAGGGMVAPLRSMGGRQAVDAVDLEVSGWRLFRRLCGSWAGEIRCQRGEACAWLKGGRDRYHAVIEDLSIACHSEVCKPEVTWSVLPRLVRRRLRPNGVALFNLLRPEGMTWDEVTRRVVWNGAASRVIHFADYENRLLIVGSRLPSARELSRRMRQQLQDIRSRLVSRIAVRHG